MEFYFHSSLFLRDVPPSCNFIQSLCSHLRSVKPRCYRSGVCYLYCIAPVVCYLYCIAPLVEYRGNWHYSDIKFGTGVLHLIQINHQPDATIFQFIILTFVYSSTCFGRFPAHCQELNDCSGSLWFYLRIVVIVVLCSWSGRSALYVKCE